MSIKNKIILFTIAVIASMPSLAQQNHTSPFSFMGIGDISNSGTAYNRSLGGLGIGLRNSYYLNGINPAGLSAMDTLSFTFEFGASGQYNVIKTNTISEPSFNGSIDYLAIGFPITKWLKSSVGFMPFSKVGYNLTENIVANDGNETLFSLQRDIKGEGGINQFYISNSIMLFKKLSLGFKFSYLFGEISKTVTDTPEATEQSVSGYSEALVTSVSDIDFSFGLQYNDIINEKYYYTIGAIYGIGNSVNATTTLTQKSYSTGHNADTLFRNVNSNDLITLPGFIGFGFSFGTEKLMVGMDYQYTMWSKAKFVNDNINYLNAQKIILGAEYIPKLRNANHYLQRMHYRLSTRFEQSYMLINSHQLKEAGITFGVGLPMKRSKSTLNIGFDFGKIGTFNSDILTQNYFKVNIDLSLHDIWFIKRKYD